MRARWNRVRLIGASWEVPTEVLRSADIEARLAPLFLRAELPPGALAQKTGVTERRLWAASDDPEPIAARVATRAVRRTGLTAEDLGAIYSASIDHRSFEPSAAHFVAQAMGGCPNAQLLDVRNACLGFIDAVSLAADRIEAGAAETAVVVAAEAGGMRRVVDSTIADALEGEVLKPEHWVPLTMGCGAVAWVLGNAARWPDATSVDSMVTRNSAEHAMLCSGRIEDDGRLRVRANGPALLRHGCPLIAQTFREAQAAYGATLDQVFMHQVGGAFAAVLERQLGFAFDPRSFVFPTLGNTGPVGMALALAQASDAGWLKPGPVTLLGAGSGLSSTCMSLTWRGGLS